MGAKNCIISGPLVGSQLSCYGNQLVMSGMPVYNLVSYQLLDEKSKIDGLSAVSRAAIGTYLLGPAGMAAGLTAKQKGIYLVSLVFTSSERENIAEVDEQVFRAIVSTPKKELLAQPVQQEQTVSINGPVNSEALLKRGNMALEDKEWDKAIEYYNAVLNLDAECAAAYLGIVKARLRVFSNAEFEAAYRNAKQVDLKELKYAMRFDAEIAAFITELQEREELRKREEERRRQEKIKAEEEERKRCAAEQAEAEKQRAAEQLEREHQLQRLQEEKSRVRVKRAKVIVPAVLLVIIGTIVVHNAKMRATYEKATVLAEHGDYQTAAQKFAELGDYEDSAAKAKQAQAMYDYGMAQELVSKGEFDAAITIFEHLGEFAEAPQMLIEAKYQYGVKMFDSGSKEDGVALLYSLGDYKDARRYKALITEEKTQSNSAYKNTVQYTYDEMGRLIRKQSATSDLAHNGYEYYDFYSNSTEEYIYDELGYLVLEHHNPGSASWTKMEYEYDEEGQKTSATISDAYGIEIERTSYDNEGRVILVNYEDEEGAVTKFESYTYDEKGNVLVHESYDSDWLDKEIKTKEIYTYESDDNGTCLLSSKKYERFQRRSSDEDFYKSDTNETSYTYNENGHLLSELVEHSSGGSVLLEYDEMGNVVQRTQKDKSGKETYVTQYRYDDYGNRTYLYNKGENSRRSTEYTYRFVYIPEPETVYSEAVELMENGKYEDAVAKFKKIGAYEDSLALVTECATILATQYEANGDNKNAIIWYETAEDKEKANELMYAYVLANKDCENISTYDYLLKLCEEDYRDSKNIYTALYKFSLTLSFDDYNLCYLVNGGPPKDGVLIRIVNEARWSNGRESTHDVCEDYTFTSPAEKKGEEQKRDVKLFYAYRHTITAYDGVTGEKLAQIVDPYDS